MIGTTLNSRFTITARLGKGAMGTVYRAADSQTGREVAVKIISRDLALDADMLERFKREGEALSQLQHPNIVGFVDAFQHDPAPSEGAGEQHVIVMEYVAGGSLHDLIKQGPLPVERAQRIAIDLCDALIRAHRLGIVHRDIKPENILMTKDGGPKLTDFGVARLNQGARLTGTGTQVGTPYYMSPEAWEGKPLDAQADIWSLGIVVYEMLTGEVPFGGDTVVMVMNKVLTAPLPDLRRKRADVPDGLAQIVQKMLARKRTDRYQTMREASADIERGHPISLTRPKREFKLPVWAGPGLGIVLVGACAIVLLVSGIWAAGALGDGLGSLAGLVGATAGPALTEVAPTTPPVVVAATDTRPPPEQPTEAGPFVGAKVEAESCDYGGRIKSIVAEDRLTVRFSFCTPEPAFLAKIAFVSFGIQPREWIEQTGGGGELLEKPIGTGPYRLDTWQRESEIVFKRFDSYWGGPANTGTLIYRWSGDEAVRLLELQAGTVDQVANVTRDNYSKVISDPTLRLLPLAGINISYLGISNTVSPFNDLRVRQALAMGIDRQAIAEAYYPAGSAVASHFTPCFIPNGCSGEAWYDFDRDQARALLAEAGFPDGFSTTLYYRDVVRTYLPESAAVAAEIQTQLQDTLGLEVQLQPVESGQFVVDAQEGKLGLYLLGWGADYLHITNFLDNHFGSSIFNFGEPYLDIAPVVEAGAAAINEAEAADSYALANELIRELVPMVPLVHGAGAAAARGDLLGAHAHPFRSPKFSLVDGGSDDTIVYMQDYEPASLYCADESDVASLHACEQVLESLYGYSISSSEVEPVLATGCEPNAALTEWVCTLREGVLFHDGSALDANDVVASWAAGLDAASPYHTGNTGSFAYFTFFWDALLNTP